MEKVGFKTDRGAMRDRNEDAFLVLKKEKVFAVADGVGGQNAGDVASRLAVTSVSDYIREHPLSDNIQSEDRDSWLRDYFLDCFKFADQAIIEYAKETSDNSGMATTLVLMYIEGEHLYVVNVGDSRAYMVRNGIIARVTEDHTYVNSLVKSGKITEKEAAVHPQKNIITRALGADVNANPDLFRNTIKNGDYILLCTDGLHGELNDAEILDIIEKDDDMDTVCKNLVAEAKLKGGRDNITVVCIEI